MIDWDKIADTFNKLRVIPRLIMLGYGVLVYHVVDWALLQAEISTQHATVISAVIGIAAILVPAYFNSGNR